MIQRVQTLYLLAAAIVSVVCLCLPLGTYSADGLAVGRMYNLWITDTVNGGHNFAVWPLFAVLVFSAAIGVYAIFMYANRILQARFCMFAMLLVVGWYVLYVVFSKILPVDEAANEYSSSLTCALPFVAMVLYFLARRAILSDEKLVRAADRIR